MSYRTVKRILGETSLERKCRFLFGGGLMLLITGSFVFYAWLNRDLVIDQNETTARLLVAPILLEKHWTWAEDNREFVPMIEHFAEELKPPDLEEYTWELVKENLTDLAHRPSDKAGYAALERLRTGEVDRVVDVVSEKGEYNYYAPVRAAGSCLKCHYHKDDGYKQGDLMGMVKITLPLKTTRQALATNNAILITTAIITVCLAMLGAYAIVRYVIVKPVLHLKDVSDEIARGNLDLRADIRTGDEFEELSHAFNRMLRHLVTIQDELREVNTDLDGKVTQLAQVNLRLYEMNNLKNEFLATMSHELRTPLNSILGFSDVLTGADNLSDKQRRFVDNIRTSGRDLLAMINDVLDLAKIESGKMELQCVEFSMADLVERQTASLRPLAEKKNIDLTWNVDEDLPVVMQDSGKLQQILSNLLSNAIKFTPEGGRVRVRAEGRDDGTTLNLIVEDTGIGIPLEEQETIFDKFRQGRAIPGQKDALTRAYGGTGLGLSIVKELSTLLGGEVTLESEFGKGSTFTVHLPLRLEPPPESLEAELQRQTNALIETALQELPPVSDGTETPDTSSNDNSDHAPSDEHAA